MDDNASPMKQAKMRKVTGYTNELIGSSSKPILPRVSFTAKELPEIKDWRVGKKYKLEIEVEMKTLHAPGDRFGNTDQSPVVSGDFEVISVGAAEQARRPGFNV